MCTVFVVPPMGFSVLLCFLVIVLTPYCSVLASKEVAYECGAHGRFEYCVDEFADCVIGCHCHPGYYFDTDTKICEPNIKLTHHYRRLYLPEPTPTATAHPTYQTYPTYSTPTTTERLNNKDHEVAKETDEIGNWLYNQFFKTIESQVISNTNNTKSNNDEKPPTRRSGGEPGIGKSKKKSRKSIRGRKKRKYAKERGLSRKLLRITEDDSLFDDSDSDSDSYSSSSDSETRSESDDQSFDKDKSIGKKSSETDFGDDHGHKKVIIFNRRPKPPLPSFIFLPNMDTPYYPPIGLPPPPLIPMYPMVPVPPMAPPMFPPFPGLPKCDDESSKSTTTVNETETHTHTTEASTTVETTTQSSTPVSTTEDTNTTSQPSIRRNRPEKHLRIPNLAKMLARTGPGKQKRQRYIKLIQLYRQKLKELRRHDPSTTHEILPEEILDEHLNSNDIPNISEDETPHSRLLQEGQEEIHIPRLEDVDFKYLSELIHRVNQSKSSSRNAVSSPPLPFDLNEDLKKLQKLQSSLPTRRNIGSYNTLRKIHSQYPDDNYYSNLGRQIASMIRNADSEVELQFSKDSKHTNSKNQFHSGLNDNSFLPRSFWERSVRSPLLQRGPLYEYLDESRILKHSNEKSLINLENEVEIYASTPHPMSLQDIENILNTIRKAHTQFRQPMTSTKRSNVSMNVNLLPKLVRPARRHNRLFDAPEKVEYITEPPETPIPSEVYVEVHPAVVTNASVFHEPETRYKVPYRDYWIFNREQVQQETRPTPVFDQTSKPIMHDNQIYNTNRIIQPVVRVVRPQHTETNKSRGEYLHFLKSRPPAKQTTPIRHETKVEKYPKLNYFSGKQHYMFDTVSYPLHQQQLLPSPLNTISNRMRSKPSYFHNQFHQSKYFN